MAANRLGELYVGYYAVLEECRAAGLAGPVDELVGDDYIEGLLLFAQAPAC